MSRHPLVLSPKTLNSVRQSSEAGFTLIELLVTMGIIGVLAAISLPSFASYANRAKEARASVHLGSVNRAQQAYRLEHNSFSDSLSSLGLSTSDSDYIYTVANAAKSHVIVEAQPTTAAMPLMAFQHQVEPVQGQRLMALHPRVEVATGLGQQPLSLMGLALTANPVFPLFRLLGKK